MTFLIKKNIKELSELILSDKFINKIFKIKNIEQTDDNVKILYKVYEIEKIKNIPLLIKNNIPIKAIKIKTLQELIEQDDNIIKVRYTTIIIEPEYISNMLSNYNFKLLLTYKKDDENNKYSILEFEESYTNKKIDETEEEYNDANEDCLNSPEEPDSEDENINNNDIIDDDIEQVDNKNETENYFLINYIFIPFVRNIIIKKIKYNYIKRINKYFI